jgi:hypothetical protein
MLLASSTRRLHAGKGCGSGRIPLPGRECGLCLSGRNRHSPRATSKQQMTMAEDPHREFFAAVVPHRRARPKIRCASQKGHHERAATTSLDVVVIKR